MKMPFITGKEFKKQNIESLNIKANSQSLLLSATIIRSNTSALKAISNVVLLNTTLTSRTALPTTPKWAICSPSRKKKKFSTNSSINMENCKLSLPERELPKPDGHTSKLHDLL